MGMQAYDGVFVSWRPDSGMYTVHATETVAWDTPSVPAGAAVGPFNTLTAGAPPTCMCMSMCAYILRAVLGNSHHKGNEVVC